MNYTLHQLRIFLTISRTGSITKAAAELNLSQPAVSIQLRQFQEQFDVALVEVVGRKLYVTEFGQEIARAAERIIDEVYAIDFKTQAYKGQMSGRLRLSIVSTAQYFVPTLISEFYTKHAGIEWQIDVTNKARVVESLEKNEIDFAVMSILPDSLKVNTLDIMEKDKLLDNADAMGRLIQDGLRKQLQGTSGFVEVRGHGLMLGIQLDRPCAELVTDALAAGLLINVTADNVVRLLPALVINAAESRQLVDMLATLIKAFLQRKPAVAPSKAH